MRQFLFIVFSLVYGLSLSRAQDNESAKYNTLQEVVVESDRAWIEGNKAVFIPTKKEKNLSKDPASLIEAMNLPTVIIDNGQIKSLNGQNITFFINGVRADDIDVATFLTKDVKRVEYMENPSEATYETVPVAINFVMTKFEVGGVTSIDLYQTIPNNGNYEVASKLVYKSMTYGFRFDGGYERDHRKSLEGEDTYYDITYDNNKYDIISREYDSHFFDRNDFINAAINARWTGSKGRATHTAALKWNRNPGSGATSTDIWSPNIFNSNSSNSFGKGRILSPQISGNYYFTFSPKWQMSANWSYSYARQNSYAANTINGTTPVANDIREDAHSVYGDITPVFNVSNVMVTALSLTFNTNRYNTTYVGSTNELLRQWKTEGTANLFFSWQFSKKGWIVMRPGMIFSSWKSGQLKRNSEINPMAKVQMSLSPNNKLRLSANLNYFNHAPQSSQTTDISIRTSELMWVSGNTSLRRSELWNPNISATWMPLKWLRGSLILNYSKSLNDFTSTYTTQTGKDGVVRTYANASPFDVWAADLVVSGSFLNDNLRINLQPTWRKCKARGEFAGKVSKFRMRGSAGYDIGNCFSIRINYGGPEEYLDEGGAKRVWHADEWDFGITYGNGNVYFSATLENVFNTYYNGWTKMISPHYYSLYNSRETGRKLSLNFSYTFGYGKKVNENIDVSLPNDISSGIVGSETKK